MESIDGSSCRWVSCFGFVVSGRTKSCELCTRAKQQHWLSSNSLFAIMCPSMQRCLWAWVFLTECLSLIGKYKKILGQAVNVDLYVYVGLTVCFGDKFVGWKFTDNSRTLCHIYTTTFPGQGRRWKVKVMRSQNIKIRNRNTSLSFWATSI